MDYISQLNLEELPELSPDAQLADLASFTDSTFFDFEQFTSDSSLKLPSYSLTESQTQLPQHEQITSLPDTLTQFFNSTTFVKQESEDMQIPVESKKRSNSSLDLSSSPLGDEVEHDKKKRNTLASARFRIKKKLKEQEMERQVKMLSERIQGYNDRINQLELENTCLKSLILEKNEKKSNDLLKSIKQKSLL